MELPQGVLDVIQHIENAGFEIYLVGGCVRDMLMDRNPQDFDLASSATPEQMIQALEKEGYRIIPTGIKHGTITVLADGKPLEITTFRADGIYTDHRRPDSVQFSTSLKDDVLRRDFTCNALAYHPQKGLIDEVGGEEDIRKGLLRCVGDPKHRFEEDALRILRALRFASQLGFRIDVDTAIAIADHKHDLRFIAPERITKEFLKLLTGRFCMDVLRQYREVIAIFLPELTPMFDFEQHNPHHRYDVYEHTLYAVNAIEPEPALRLAALFHDCGKPATFITDEQGIGHFYGHAEQSAEYAETAMERLRVDNDTKNKVLLLILHHSRMLPETDKGMARLLNKIDEEDIYDLLKLKKADCVALAPPYNSDDKLIDDFKRRFTEYLNKKPCYRTNMLAVNGSDLLAMGYKEGARIGELLRDMLVKVIDGELTNDKEALLAYAKEQRGEGYLYL